MASRARDNNNYGTNDTRTADPDEFDERSQYKADFIKLWKTVPVPKGYK